MANLIVFILIVWLVLALWVGADAHVNSTQSGFLWGVAVLFGGIFGALIYVLVGRDDVEDETTQPRHGIHGRSHPVLEDSPDEPASHRCQSCGERYYIDSSTDITTCRNCGGVKVERSS